MRNNSDYHQAIIVHTDSLLCAAVRALLASRAERYVIEPALWLHMHLAGHVLQIKLSKQYPCNILIFFSNFYFVIKHFFLSICCTVNILTSSCT